jgi:hypothetical protein
MLVVGAKLNQLSDASLDQEMGWSQGGSEKPVNAGKSLH